jgi:uncharacterized protein (DUF488 family)
VEAIKGPTPGLRLTGFFKLPPLHLNQWKAISGQWVKQAHERLFDFRDYALEEYKARIEVFRRRIAEKLFEKSDDQFDLRTFQTASTAMQCFTAHF